MVGDGSTSILSPRTGNIGAKWFIHEYLCSLECSGIGHGLFVIIMGVSAGDDLESESATVL